MNWPPPLIRIYGLGRAKAVYRPGDEVASFDPNTQQGLGAPKPGKVTRTFTNITKTIINLRGTHMTPGHVVLMDNGEWDIIARALKDERAIVEERKGADGSWEATLVRGCTGAPLGSLEDTPIKVIFADPATGRDRLALVRAGIPVKGKKLDDGSLRLYTMADILTMQDYTVEPDGRIICKGGHRYEGTPWACDIEPPYHLPMRENRLLALDDETYTPPWFLDLPLEQEEVGQMVVNGLPNPKMFVNPTAATLPRPQLGLAASNAAPRPPSRKERHKRAAKLRTVT